MTTTTPDTSREAIEALAYRLGVIANEEVVGKPLVDVYPDARDGRAALLALLERAEAAEGEAAEALALADARCQEKAFVEDALRAAEREKVASLEADAAVANEQYLQGTQEQIEYAQNMREERDAALEEAKRLGEVVQEIADGGYFMEKDAKTILDEYVTLCRTALTPSEPSK